MLSGKKVLLGVTGSIAAYKTPHLVRLLTKQNNEVKVILTPSAIDFVTPLSLSTASHNPVYSHYFNPQTGEWANHVELGLWADMLVIAPASANTLAKMATGVCDNLLLATYLSARCRVIVFPAMDLDMYRHQTTQHNIAVLRSQGITVIEPDEGELASGLSGKGRMPEPETIVQLLDQQHEPIPALKNKKVLITAGPTYEAIDPVRFIGNHSSGKMGIALARAAQVSGAEVTLICGPVSVPLPGGMTIENVVSAAEMEKAVLKYYAQSDVVIMAAAVADYTPAHTSDQKIKKKEGEGMDISLVRTNDILAKLGKTKNKQVLVGFALETQNEQANAMEKLKNKNLDFIVLNSLRDKGAGFGHDTNKITIAGNSNKFVSFELMSKQALAFEILKFIVHEK